jgi:two-component system phosphate regulon sensor histidine kinase PhoR
LAIVSNRNNRVSELSFAKVFLKDFFWINSGLILVLSLLLNLSLIDILMLSVTIIFSSIILLFLVGLNRRKSIEKIDELILSIKNGMEISVEEIKLDSNYEIIETNLKAMFKKNQEDIANIKKLAQARTDFLGNVSHELRTPIFSIQGFLETLLNGAIDDENVNRRFVEKAFTHTKNLNVLLNDLIDISMIESGQMRMLPTYFNISDFVNTIVEELETLASAKGLKIETKFYDGEVLVFGDKDKIKQVFVNLISNAIRYSDNGPIIIETKDKDVKVEILVKDSGCGIPEVALPRVFERFYRVDKARSKTLGGTGLGLAIVKHIVEAHGSKIEVKSKVGKGSTFAFHLRKKQYSNSPL